MALAGRIQHPGMGDVESIAVHQFTALISLYFQGKPEVTLQKVIDAFNLDTQEQNQVAILKATYDVLSANQQFIWLLNLEWAGVAYEKGTITTAEYKSIMGL